jgi:hypothetical protein
LRIVLLQSFSFSFLLIVANVSYKKSRAGGKR